MSSIEHIDQELIDEQMRLLVEEVGILSSRHKIEANGSEGPLSERVTSIPIGSTILNDEGDRLFPKPFMTETAQGSFIDLSAIRATRAAQQMNGGEKLTNFVVLSTVEMNPLATMAAWQTGIRDHAYSVPMRVLPFLFRNPEHGTSGLNTASYWPYQFNLTENHHYHQGLEILKGFRRANTNGFVFRPHTEMLPLEPSSNADEKVEIEFEHAPILDEMIEEMKKQTRISAELIEGYRKAGIEYVGDLNVVSVAVHAKTGKRTQWHHTSDQHDNDAVLHTEISNLMDAEKTFGKENLKDVVLITSLEPCAMCAIACHQAGIGKIVYVMDSKELADAKSTLLNPHKKAMVELAKQDGWPFQVPYEKAGERYTAAALHEATKWTRQDGIYRPETIA